MVQFRLWRPAVDQRSANQPAIVRNLEKKTALRGVEAQAEGVEEASALRPNEFGDSREELKPITKNAAIES